MLFLASDIADPKKSRSIEKKKSALVAVLGTLMILCLFAFFLVSLIMVAIDYPRNTFWFGPLIFFGGLLFSTDIFDQQIYDCLCNFVDFLEEQLGPDWF